MMVNPDTKVMKFSDFLSDILSLKETKSEPKIDMAVKCIDNKGACISLTFGKYYPLRRIFDLDGKYAIKNDVGNIDGYYSKRFKLFKVGDRFKWECENNIIYVITEFKNINDLLTVSLKEKESQESWVNWEMESFDKAFTKIEPTEEKEPAKQEDLRVGEYVEILSDAIDQLAAQGEVLKLNTLFIKDLVSKCTELCSYCGSRGSNKWSSG